MTVNSLVNFGVPGIQGQRSAPLQPIMRNKFRITFENFGAGNSDNYVVTQQVRNTTLPIIYGIYGCGPSSPIITIQFLDDITNGCLRHVLAQCGKQRAAANNVMLSTFDMKIEILSATVGPSVIRTYSFKDCLIDRVESDPLTYEDPTALEYSVHIKTKTVAVLDADLTPLW